MEEGYNVRRNFNIGEDMEINDNEGDALLHHLQKFREIGIKLEELTVDGKYPTYENIAKNAVAESAGLKPAEGAEKGAHLNE